MPKTERTTKTTAAPAPASKKEAPASKKERAPRKKPAKAAPVPEPVMPEPAPVEESLENVAPPDLPVLYDKVEIAEYSTTSKHGPLTVADAKTMMGWETEKEYQARMVEENPDSKPEHWLFGDDYHCLNIDKVKVRCWNNANNRPFDSGWCEDLIHTILYGQWAGPHTIPGETVNGETVRISRYGRVLSGQHQDTALILADEWLQKARAKQGEDDKPRYPFWEGHEHPFIETVVITGLSEDPRVLRTIDYVKPRTTADMLYTMEVFRQNRPGERKEMTRMLAQAIDTLWARTAAKGYKTHPEVVGFLERHKRLLKCVEHLFKVNSEDNGRRINKLRLTAGMASALCYLMGCSSQKTTDYSDEYRNEMPPSERNLDWSYWDRALLFWSRLAEDRSFEIVRNVLVALLDSSPTDEANQGLGGNIREKLAILAAAWERFRDHPDKAGPAFLEEDREDEGIFFLEYTDTDDKGKKLPEGKIELVNTADFYGIDAPRSIAKGEPGARTPAPMELSREEIERATAEARARRAGNR